MIVGFQKLHKDAIIPTRNYNSAGLDFYCIEDIEIKPLERKLVKTGIGWYIDRENKKEDDFLYYMQLQGRSGLALKHGIIVLGGVIDEDYRGDIGFILFNSDKKPIFFKKGSKIGQGVIHQLPNYNIMQPLHVEWRTKVKTSERKERGFGSSGI